VRPDPVAGEERHPEEGIPGGDSFAEGGGLAGQAAQAVAQDAVEAFEVDGVWQLCRLADCRPDLDAL
jgi:hypothetical protein